MTGMPSQVLAAESRIRQLQAYYGWHDGSPEGEVDAPRGAIRADRLTGNTYRKTTELGTLTGWVSISSGGGGGSVPAGFGDSSPLFISETAPTSPPDTYMWVELLGGGDFTIWIEDGTP